MAQNKYEAMVVYSVKQGDENAQVLAEKFKALIEKHGTLESVDEWGKRKLAYAINYEEDGFYVLYNFTAEPEFPAEFERVLKITDGVLRWLVTAAE